MDSLAAFFAVVSYSFRCSVLPLLGSVVLPRYHRKYENKVMKVTVMKIGVKMLSTLSWNIEDTVSVCMVDDKLDVLQL